MISATAAGPTFCPKRPEVVMEMQSKGQFPIRNEVVMLDGIYIRNMSMTVYEWRLSQSGVPKDPLSTLPTFHHPFPSYEGRSVYIQTRRQVRVDLSCLNLAICTSIL